MQTAAIPVALELHSTNKRTDRQRRRRPLSGLVLLLLLAFLVHAPLLTANPLYVSPTGNDSNNGSEGAPFQTIERARTAARAATSNQTSDVVVYLRAGRYEPAGTLRFDGNDSGRNGHRVIYRSYPGEEVLISGGRRVTGWSHFRDGIYQANSPVTAYRQLYINGQRGVRARTPNTGYDRLSDWGDDKTVRVPASRVANWSNLNQVEMVISKHWHQSRLRIASINTSGDTAYIVPQEPERTIEWNVQWPNREPNQPYFFENSLDFLDQPGEWYLDRGQQKVYYLPRPGENIANVEIIAPRLERLLEINGASNLHFVGLTFEHTNWTHPDERGFIPIQANLYVDPGGVWLPSGIHLEFTHNVRLERNILRNMGGGAIDLHRGTNQTEIIGNAIADIAASGISVYTQVSNRNPPENEKSRGDTVRNNYVTRVGRDYPGGVAIVGTYPDGMVVEHNELFNNPYSGVSVGWGWTNQDTALRNNIVRYNRIHQVMNLMDDGAGIYTLSKQPGGLYEENFIYDLTRNQWAGTYEITALYLDEQTEGITMRNNVVRNLSGVNLFKQNRVQDGLNNVYNNGHDIANADAIIAKSGLQVAYQDIPDLVSGKPTTPPGPFSGTPIPLPGRIQAENFDHGGDGKGYHDTTSSNLGGEYRLDESVDIENCSDTGGGYSIGYTASSEWLEYTVNVKNSGTYELHLRLASINSGRYFHISLDGQNITGRIDAPNTGGWQNWQTVKLENINLPAGERKLRVNFDTGDFNINWIEAVAVTVNTPPVVTLTSPAPGATIQAGQPISISADSSDPDGSVTKVEFLAGDLKIGETTTTPFSVVWNSPTEGTHSITARATDNEGSTTTSEPVSVSVAPTREPLGGAPAAIPGRIFTVDYDTGGTGLAYYDTTELNTGGAYRVDEQVDIEPALDTEAAYNVGWVAEGEWIHYTVEVAEAGLYNIRFRLASETDQGRFHLQFDGKDVTGRLQVPNTGAWQNWTTVILPNVNLVAGTQTMRLSLDGGEFNISYIDFELGGVITRFDQWQQLHFSPEQLNNPDISGPGADPYGTGIANLLCYAFNRTPGTGHRKNLPVLGKMKVDDQKYLTLTYTRLAEAVDLGYVVEASSNMVDWTTDANQAVEVSATRAGNIETVVVRDKQPVSGSGKRFLRLRVKQLDVQL